MRVDLSTVASLVLSTRFRQAFTFDGVEEVLEFDFQFLVHLLCL